MIPPIEVVTGERAVSSYEALRDSAFAEWLAVGGAPRPGRAVAVDRPRSSLRARYVFGSEEEAASEVDPGPDDVAYRVLEGVALRMAIADRSAVWLDLGLGDPLTAVIAARRSSLADGLVVAFDALWAEADAPGYIKVTAIAEPTLPLEILRKLATGTKDHLIARELGISQRSLSRRLRELMDVLGASSRFQAGVEAARRGWV